ncbi:MAG: hypothetical protein FWE37_07245 [Spirochaetaceae bacterium]|nr:hypothetical protein [Spirochaetaceae bacterium]
MKKIIPPALLLFLAPLWLLGQVVPFPQSATQSPSFAWWRAIDIDDGPTREDIFNALLDDITSVATIGYKALPVTSIGQPDGSDEPYFLEQGSLVGGVFTDFAIEGLGFFRLQSPSGDTFYTRAGNFRLNTEGFVVSQQGYQLMPPLQLNRTQTNIFTDEQSRLFVPIAGSFDSQQIYHFELWLPANGAAVERDGVNFTFSSAYQVNLPEEGSVVHSHSLELSTTNTVEALVAMMATLHELRREQADESNLFAANTIDFDFKIYMVDFLLREYARSSGDLADLRRFERMVRGVAGQLTFN